ncbi:MAG TPA: class I SAM-dependent methyltransferase [Candidatus Elarobacter sp.]|nr:class I SAM-dependent methyltransferase [Candidatus Elarobacter sp.]
MTDVAVATACAVCGTPSGAPAYRHDGAVSISSTARAIAVPTIVYVCAVCAHVQTPPLADIGGYYDTAYNVHLESDDADDLYAVRDGVPVYRAQHQANVALEKLNLPSGAAVLDYGCGKGMSLRALLAARSDLDGAVFDVSDAYRTHWDTFVPSANQAAYTPPPSWAGRFDAVLSFFALEHVGDPRGFLRKVRALLRPGGELHLTVPNVRRNVGDFIVVDHVNHFMPTSLHRALSEAGFDRIRIDEESHDAAYVVDARRGTDENAAASAPDVVAGYVAEAQRFAAFWSAASDAVALFERERARGRKSAIYGSGFYGVFIASRLADRSNLAYFLDRNPHQQAKRIFDRAVPPPEAVDDDVEVIYAGLNPARAREIIAGVPALHKRAREHFYL